MSMLFLLFLTDRIICVHQQRAGQLTQTLHAARYSNKCIFTLHPLNEIFYLLGFFHHDGSDDALQGKLCLPRQFSHCQKGRQVCPQHRWQSGVCSTVLRLDTSRNGFKHGYTSPQEIFVFKNLFCIKCKEKNYLQLIQ